MRHFKNPRWPPGTKCKKWQQYFFCSLVYVDGIKPSCQDYIHKYGIFTLADGLYVTGAKRRLLDADGHVV